MLVQIVSAGSVPGIQARSTRPSPFRSTNQRRPLTPLTAGAIGIVVFIVGEETLAAAAKIPHAVPAGQLIVLVMTSSIPSPSRSMAAMSPICALLASDAFGNGTLQVPERQSEYGNV